MADKLVALRRSLDAVGAIDQRMLRYVLDQSRDCIKILNPAGLIEYINSEGQCALHLTNLGIVLGRSWTALWPKESRPAVQGALDEAKSSQGSTFEAWRPGTDGEKVWWQISVSPLRESSGELVGILTISRDVTDLVRLRDGERTLALEMKHRLRNAYTVASAIVTQSARGNETQREFADTVTARLADVALSQTRLLEAGEKSWTLSDLVRTLVKAHGEGAAGVCFTGAAGTAVDRHEAMLIALVLGELTNNSLKYGALTVGKPVKVAWSTQKADALVIRWREPLAKPLDVPLGARNLGSGYSLMARMARSQKALFEFEADHAELRATLTLRDRPDSSRVQDP